MKREFKNPVEEATSTGQHIRTIYIDTTKHNITIVGRNYFVVVLIDSVPYDGIRGIEMAFTASEKNEPLFLKLNVDLEKFMVSSIRTTELIYESEKLSLGRFGDE